MKSMIFAAGLGTRLKPLTDTMPKALVPVAGKPLLEHIITKLIQAGSDEIIINVHHFAEQIIDFLKEKNNFDIRIEISDERDNLLETGGGIRKAAWFFDDGKPFIVHNVDILSNLNLTDLYQQHLRTNSLATLTVSDRNTFRYLLFNDDLLLKGWMNEKTSAIKPLELKKPELYNKFAFSGIQVLSPAIFPLMESMEEKFSIIDFYLNHVKTHKIHAFVPENYQMLDVGKLNVLDEAEHFVRNQYV